MHYVYLIRSLSSPDQTYVGLTDDLKQRLIKHNAGGSAHTSKYVPWGNRELSRLREKTTRR